MITEEQKKEIESLFWWHRIELEPGYVTPGVCPHGTGTDIETRFGLLKRLDGLSVLDVGTFDGLFAFECEKRGAESVMAIDIYQRCAGQLNDVDSNKPFQLAKKILNSNVQFKFTSLEDFERFENPFIYNYSTFDLILYYGVMYHIENPLGAVKKLMSLINPGGTILLETTISTKSDLPIMEYRPGFENDPTNTWYPTKECVKLMFMENGAKSVDVVYSDPYRATFRVSC